jgi:hypothetical protein
MSNSVIIKLAKIMEGWHIFCLDMKLGDDLVSISEFKAINLRLLSEITLQFRFKFVLFLL